MPEFSFEKEFKSGHDSHPESAETAAEVLDTVLENRENDLETLEQEFPAAFAVAKSLPYFSELSPDQQRQALRLIQEGGIDNFIKKITQDE